MPIHITRIAHGGEGIGQLEDGRVVFIPGAIPGDTVEANITKSKKRWARAELTEVVEASEDRVVPACPAAAAGAGCCDYSHINPAAQPELKRDVLRGQLASIAGVRDDDLAGGIALRTLQPTLGWRTRVRLGVDESGRAGVRRARSGDVIASQRCTQPVPGLMDLDQRFTPGSEVVAVIDAAGARHVVETARVQRGRRVEAIENVVEGTGEVTERIGGVEFRFPATAFWQAHVRAPEVYSEIIRSWGAGDYANPVAWDLYGGVGAFVPAIAEATGGAHIMSVDYSPAATAAQQRGLAAFDVEMVAGKVEASVGKLKPPGLVVLDPPRAGAGEPVVAAVAAARPERVIHIGCDPATFARDLAAWRASGYGVGSIVLVDAFPNTHHFESIALLEPVS
ncbi:TRAM domain-containing protein [Corynebacterium sp. Q4381]|uniref:class I SAM-dependent RNA methyltransferase n=1 Tax=Corynebacterium sp. Marseille-Q4381 TaxID=3121597 RepID=UPI002FE503E5